MKRLGIASVVLLALGCADALLSYVLSDNLASGIYPIEADSISIPLFEALLSSVVLITFLAIGLVIPKRNRIALIVSVIPTLLAIAVSWELASTWFLPNHFMVAVAYAIVAALCGWAWWQDWRIQSSERKVIA